MARTGDPRPRAFRPEQAAGARVPGPPSWDLAVERRIDDGKGLASFLGWFSIGLGLGEVLAPEALAEWLGMEENAELIRLYGFREIATGLGIFAQRRPTGWIWGRVAGDALDLATLAPGLDPDNPRRGNVLLAVAAVAGVTVLDVICGRQLGNDDRYRRA